MNEEELENKLRKNKIIIRIIAVILIIVIITLIVTNKIAGVTVENNLSNLGLVTTGDDYIFYYKYQVRYR